MYPITLFIVTTALLFLIGLAALTIKRDLVRLLIGIEILFNAANLFFVALSTQSMGMIDPLPQSVVMMALVLDGTVIAVAAQVGVETVPVADTPGRGDAGDGHGGGVVEPDLGLALRDTLAQEVRVAVEGNPGPIAAQAGLAAIAVGV